MIKTLEYAKALFLIAKEDGATDEVLSDVLTVREILGENPEYRNLLDTPALSKSERLALIDEAFSSLNENVKNLLKMLAQKREVYAFGRIASDFSSLVDEERGIIRAEAVSAVEMTDSQLDALKKKLDAITGKTVIVKNTVDPAIIGGVTLRYSGLQLDGSLKTRLKSFEKALLGAVI